MTIPMQWALRRRMMMSALGSVIDVAALSITYTGAHTDYGMVTMSDGARYRLLAFTSSGTLSIEQPVNCEVCVVGGGANGESTNYSSRHSGCGGAGAYMKNQNIAKYGGGPVVVGAGESMSSIGDVSVSAVSGKNGGSGGGAGSELEPGTGDGISKYPFGDSSYSLWLSKPHCGGGGGGAAEHYNYYNGKDYTGGNGGSNGSNGTRYVESGYNGGLGGAYGGGRGWRVFNDSSQSGSKNATYYGSGGGGGPYGTARDDTEIFNAGASGYQGIVYMRIPEEPPAYISDLALGALINVGTDGGDGTPNYEIADKNNLVSGGVVLVRKNIHSKSAFGSSAAYSNSTLDNKMTSIYNSLPGRLQSKIMDATFDLEGSGSITRKVFALTYTMAGFGVNNGTTEGKALQRYDSNANRKKEYSGSAWSWWLSSRRDTSYPRDVTTVGAVDYNRPDFSTGVVPAFAIPSETRYDATPNTDGSYNLILNTYISELPLGTLINVGTDGGAGAANYEIADINNLVPGGVVLVRKNIYSKSAFGSNSLYPNSTLDNLIKTTIYNEMPQKLRDKMMDVSFTLSASGAITRKMFALTYTMAGFGDNGDVTEGKALQLYTSDASRKKTFNGSASSWWLSSRFSSDYIRFVAGGGAVQLFGPSNESGVVPAFVIPGDTLGKLTPNTDGSYNLIL